MPPILTCIRISAGRIRLLCSSREQKKDQYSEAEKGSQQYYYKDNTFLTVRVVEVQCSLS